MKDSHGYGTAGCCMDLDMCAMEQWEPNVLLDAATSSRGSPSHVSQATGSVRNVQYVYQDSGKD